MAAHSDEEHELPALEAMLAGTLVLMTGYGQALQAELNPAHRVLMGAKIARNLALLSEHPALSDAFRRVLGGLQQRWQQMNGCTAAAAVPLPGNVLACAASPTLQ